MKRLHVFAAAAAVAMLFSGAVISSPHASAAGPGTGPDLSLGTISLVSGQIQVPIVASGSGFDPYAGVNSTLLWDPAVFSYAGHSEAGGVLVSPFCADSTAPSFASSTTGPHNGVSDGANVGCTSLSGATSLTGLITTFLLTPLTTGVCSPLHLLTFDPPDSDANGTGSLDASAANQPNSYVTIDSGADETGEVIDCVGAAATPTATSTIVVGATNTPAATGTPKILRTVTPSPTVSGTAVPGTPAPPSDTTPSAPEPGAPATQPAGGRSGAIRLPDTGSGDAATPAGTSLADLLPLVAAGFVGLSALGYAWRRRARTASK